MRHIAVATSLCAALSWTVCETAAQTTAPLEQISVPVQVDSGFVINSTTKAGAIFQETIRVPDATWIRLTFDQVILGQAPEGSPETFLRITSLADGAVQTLNEESLRQWHLTSAYLNGDAVSLELVADAEAERSRVLITSVLAGPPADGGIATICGPLDDRLPSDDGRTARTFPGGCTAWLISDLSNCFLTAGHCVPPGVDIVEFNVPQSTGDGTIQHPGPENQYPVDPGSVQFVNDGVGNDWCYFGCFPNSETLLTAFEAQGDAFDLATTAPPVAGQTIRITGYGADGSPPEWNQIQQTHTGPYLELEDDTVRYQVDTQGGNSGSAVFNEDTGEAIGIHTHGGCDADGGANQGTNIGDGGLQSALASPQGVCLPLPPVGFSFPDGIPDELDPAGDTIRVVVFGQNGGMPEEGTGQLHVDLGSGYMAFPMVETAPNEYDAVFPAIACGTVVDFYFSVESKDDQTITNPLLAPGMHYSAVAAQAVTVLFADDFEAELGWTVSSGGGLTDGQWQRAFPLPNTICDRGNPGTDADGSGQCFLTDNDPTTCNSDVDNGSTILTSPILDATEGLPIITYWRWFSNSAGTNPFQDIFLVEVSDDDGANWVELETVGPTGPDAGGGWFEVSFVVEDFVALTDQFRIRFTASDTDPQSIVEAAVDGVRLTNIKCDTGVTGDLNGDGIVDIIDLLILLAAWGPCPDPCPPTCPADLDGDCMVGAMELLIILANWTLP